MQLIVGLGNPGPTYAATRHNVGFMALDRWSSELVGSWKQQFQSQFMATRCGDRKLYLCKPQTFMNLSGQSVAQAMGFYRIPLSDVLVVCDDFALPLGRLRFRERGSSGGHNGISSVFECTGSWDFPRLRVGIGPVPPRWDPKDFVLGQFDKTETDLLGKVVLATVDAIKTVISDGMATAMNRFNGLDLNP
jgi:PTH1 family peptidyl-tRNA hydrolase